MAASARSSRRRDPTRVIAPLYVYVTTPRDASTSRRLLGQGRILESLAGDDTVLIGTLARLGKQFKLSPDDLRACLRELTRVRWIAVQTQPFGRLTIRLERRAHPEASVIGVGERRRSLPDAWRLERLQPASATVRPLSRYGNPVERRLVALTGDTVR
jgi:hypothetical protein